MSDLLSTSPARRSLLIGLVTIGVLVIAALLGSNASSALLGLLVVGSGGLLLLVRPLLGLPLLVLSALLIPLQIGTGTAVQLNAVTLLLPVLLGIWLLTSLRQSDESLPSKTIRPLLLFLLAGLFSLAIGHAMWDPSIPRSSSLIVVQLAQWTIYAFSAGAYFMVASQIRSPNQLIQLTWLFLGVAAVLAALSVTPWGYELTSRLATVALGRAPFWLLLTALALSFLLFAFRYVSWLQRLVLLLALGSAFVYVFVVRQDTISNAAAVLTAVVTLVWLRWPKWRIPAVVLVLLLVMSGVLLPTVWNFAGGEDEWLVSGGSRLALIGRVLEDTMRNPITGLGPAAYRVYGATRPLTYRHIIWYDPRISSHNNYVDIYSHFGLIGMMLLAWFGVEVTRLGVLLRRRCQTASQLAYVNGMLAAGAGALVLMLFADWILPFVYNIGFPGFQASVLVWLFLGGLVALDRLLPDDAPPVEPTAVD